MLALFLHIPLLVDAEQAGDGLLDGESADLPAVEHGGEGAPVGLAELQAAQALADVGGDGERVTGDGDCRLAVVGRRLHLREEGEQVLHQLVGVVAGVGGGHLVGDVVLLRRVLLLHEEVDDVAVRDELRVVLHLGIDVRGVGHAGRRLGGEVAHEVRLRVNHRDAEERLVLRLGCGVVLQRPVKLRPLF